MAKEQKPEPIGILHSAFNFDALTPEDWQRIEFRANPDLAINRIKELETALSEVMAITQDQGEITREVFRIAERSLRISDEFVDDAERYRRQIDNLDTRRANAARAHHVRKISDQVAHIVRRELHLKPDVGEAAIIRHLVAKNETGTPRYPWLVRMDGKPYKKGGLRDIVAPLLDEARKAQRRSRL